MITKFHFSLFLTNSKAIVYFQKTWIRTTFLILYDFLKHFSHSCGLTAWKRSTIITFILHRTSCTGLKCYEVGWIKRNFSQFWCLQNSTAFLSKSAQKMLQIPHTPSWYSLQKWENSQYTCCTLQYNIQVVC